jgi:hypothetical protein
MPIVPEGKPLASHIVDIENIRFNLDTPSTIGSFCQVPEKRASHIYACEAHRSNFTSLSEVVCSVLEPTEYIGKGTGPNCFVSSSS